MLHMLQSEVPNNSYDWRFPHRTSSIVRLLMRNNTSTENVKNQITIIMISVGGVGVCVFVSAMHIPCMHTVRIG